MWEQKRFPSTQPRREQGVLGTVPHNDARCSSNPQWWCVRQHLRGAGDSKELWGVPSSPSKDGPSFQNSMLKKYIHLFSVLLRRS